MRKEREALLEKLGARADACAAIPRITGVAQDFARQCQGCHGADGMGARDAIPRLRAFVGYFTHLPEGRDYLMRVPGVVFAPIDDQRLAAVLNWTLATFSPGGAGAGLRAVHGGGSQAPPEEPDRRDARHPRGPARASCARRACSPVTTTA